MYRAILNWVTRPWFFFSLRWLVRVAARVVYGLRGHDLHHVPRDGGLIVAANHIGTLDPPILGVTIPRPISFMAKQELFDNPCTNLLFRGVRAFPVDRGKSDLTAIREALRRLSDDDAVGVFIQGTRNRGDAEALNGAAYLAQRAGVPILPAAIWREGRRFHVRFGEPIQIEGRDREAMRAATTATMQRIYDLLPDGVSVLPPESRS